MTSEPVRLSPDICQKAVGRYVGAINSIKDFLKFKEIWYSYSFFLKGMELFSSINNMVIFSE